jgi:hypothetical protein
MSELSDDFQKMIEDTGYQVLINTAPCVEHKLAHQNCAGCISEVGCSKLASLMGIQLTPLMYQPKDYNDYEQMNQSIQRKIKAVMDAKTIQEILAVQW